MPGLGTKAVGRILKSRRWRAITLDDVARLTVSIAKVRPFIVTADWRPTLLTDRADLRTPGQARRPATRTVRRLSRWAGEQEEHCRWRRTFSTG